MCKIVVAINLLPHHFEYLLSDNAAINWKRLTMDDSILYLSASFNFSLPVKTRRSTSDVKVKAQSNIKLDKTKCNATNL